MRHIGKLGLSLALVSLTVLGTGKALAQGASAPSAGGHRIAVVDVAKIFKEHPAIREQVKAVEAELKSYEAELKTKRQELQQTAEKLKTFKVGSPDYIALEEKLASMDSKLRLEMNRKRKELADLEAKIYFDNYQKISQAVEAIAKHNKIDMVLRYNSENMDLEKADSVIRGVMKSIVYHGADLDMTPIVTRYLDSMMGTNVAGAGATTKR